MSFVLPPGLPAAARPDLERACVTGGYDQTPAPTQVKVAADRLTVAREPDESGHVLLPWKVEGFGQLVGSTSTLMERPAPYHLAVELARGKLNQVRCQLADWRMIGLQVPARFDEKLGHAVRVFGRSLTSPPDEAAREAQHALTLAYKAAHELTRMYVEQLFEARRAREEKIDAVLGCRLDRVPPPPFDGIAPLSWTGVCVPLTWRDVEPQESQYDWSQADAVVAWAASRNLKVAAGPLIDFSPAGLPDWLGLWEADVPSLAGFMCDYVETAVSRYRGAVKRWQVTAASNNAEVLGLPEDDLIRLTHRLAEAALSIDPSLEVVVGLAQPWGDYLTDDNHTYSPFIFADTLLRSGLRLAGFDLEWFMGTSPRGSHCRDAMEASRLLDLFAMLGVPAQVTLAYPSAGSPDPRADEAEKVGAGHWRDGFSAEAQADWAETFAAVALCKPHVRAVHWSHLSDKAAHRLPHSGLLDLQGMPKPAFDQLRKLRQEHLK